MKRGDRSYSPDIELAVAPALSQGFGGDGEAIGLAHAALL